jgi:hypothetical protein
LGSVASANHCSELSVLAMLMNTKRSLRLLPTLRKKLRSRSSYTVTSRAGSVPITCLRTRTPSSVTGSLAT